MDKLNGLKLKGLPNVRWDKVLKRLDIEEQTGYKKSAFREFSKFIASPFLDKLDLSFEKSGDLGKILFYQSFFERKSYRDQIINAHNLIPSDLFIYNEKRKISYHFGQGLKIILLYMPSWFFSFWREGASLWQAIGYLTCITKFYYLLRLIQKDTDIYRYKLLVTFYDSMPEEAFLSQMFQLNNIETATLQHGAFTAWRENSIINCGVELRTFNSDYFLCWNKFTVDEGKKCGIPEEKMKVVGILGYIGTCVPDWTNPHNGVFGVVIGHESFEEENLKLIECANLIAKEKDLKYYLKLHPNYDDHHFDNVVRKENYIGNVRKGISILEYANMVEFSIVGSSTVYVELIYINHDVIRYSSGAVTDKFKDVTIGKVVTSPEQIKNLLLSPIHDSKTDDSLFYYLCGYKDARSEYIKFLGNYTA